MTFRIPKDQLTNEGPFSFGAIRSLTKLETAYAEYSLQLALQAIPLDSSTAPQAMRAPGAMVLGRNATPVVALPKDASPTPFGEKADRSML